jgi:hypothetical protein
MFFIPGPIIAALTFPGVIVHEFAHQLFCRLFGVAIFDVCYFRFGNPAGYVIHEQPAKTGQQIWIGVGPFIVNSVLGAIIAAPSSIQVIQFEAGSPLDYTLIWLGVSVAMHAFPSTGDANTLRDAVAAPGVPLGVKMAAYPIVGLILLGAIGSLIWLDALYGVGVALAVPKFLVTVLA